MAYQKVMIAGLDTTKLAVLTEAEKMTLLREMQETGSAEAREKLILGNLRLVLSVIQRFTGRGEDADDLFQIGVIGLMKAINNFDLSKDVRFSTYCVPMIAGELRRHLRDHHAVRVSRSLRDLAYKAMQAREKLTASLGREPTAQQIADELGAERTDIVAALESISDPVSLYEPIYSDSGDPLYLIDQIGDPNSEASAWMSELALRDALAALSDREKNILHRRFWLGKTQMEVANEIGISQAQVSRLEKTAIARIKAQL
jgi:RNA polymerase sporulation-specific sigma factor